MYLALFVTMAARSLVTSVKCSMNVSQDVVQITDVVISKIALNHAIGIINVRKIVALLDFVVLPPCVQGEKLKVIYVIKIMNVLVTSVTSQKVLKMVKIKLIIEHNIYLLVKIKFR